MKNFSILLLLLLAVIYGGRTQTAEVTYVPLGRTAQFSCNKTEAFSFISWVVNLPSNVSYSTLTNEDKAKLRARGIVSESSSAYLNLTILVSLENNGTVVRCRELLHSATDNRFGTPILVIAVGPPLPPPLTVTTLNNSHLLLEWDEPFSWPGYSISSYNVQKVASGGVVTTLVQSTQERHYLYSSADSDGQETECSSITFKVSAIVNEVGTGQPANVTTGLPIPPGTFGNITTQVRFQRNGTPEATVTIEPPIICVYETVAELVLVLRVQEDDTPISIRTETYSGQTQELVVHYPVGLEGDKKYDLSLTTSTLAGNSSTSITFNTSFITTVKPSSSRNLLLIVVISVCAGFMVFVLLLLLLTAACCKCRQRKHLERDLRMDYSISATPPSDYAIPDDIIKCDLTTVNTMT